MKQDGVDSEELMRFWRSLDNGHSSSTPTDPNSVDVTISRSLVALANRIQPDAAFKKALEKRLLTVQGSQLQVRSRSFPRGISQISLIWRTKIRSERRFVYGLGLAALLLIALWMTGPTIAQFALPHFAPREVTKWPALSEVTMAEPPEPVTTEIISQLEEQAGFAVLTPQYVPSGCQLHEGSYLPEPIGEVQLVYRSADNLPCFTTNQRAIDGDATHTPFIYEGSGEEITIHGQPAFYIDGIWVVEGLGDGEGNADTIELAPGELEELIETATWVEGHKQLVFENGALLVRLDGDMQLTKEELIRIAESME